MILPTANQATLSTVIEFTCGDHWKTTDTAVLDALKGGKALGAASLVLRFNH